MHILILLITAILCFLALGLGWMHSFGLTVFSVAPWVIVIIIISAMIQIIIRQSHQLTSVRLKNLFLISRADKETLTLLEDKPHFEKCPQKSQSLQSKSSQATTSKPALEPQILDQTFDLIIQNLSFSEKFNLSHQNIFVLNTGKIAYEKIQLNFQESSDSYAYNVSQMLYHNFQGPGFVHKKIMIIARFIFMLSKRISVPSDYFIAIPLDQMTSSSLKHMTKKIIDMWENVAKQLIISIKETADFLDQPSNQEQLERYHIQGVRYALQWDIKLLDTDIVSLHQTGVRFIFISFEELIGLRQNKQDNTRFENFCEHHKKYNIACVVTNLSALTPQEALTGLGIEYILKSDENDT